ncbi:MULTISPECIES: PEP-CTERM sorting domain-containing protein [unclassified Coleofasciculus]|uniref:PEP-CTERM sorting domain-containing protein n=1 Tax=unclassified Coleofasciculus TaxID=2692782 RepID=UPI001D13C7B7|nr:MULTISPECIES: PEP-CTERM sorting domain-containing protein [unclassified Coleofasciculus]
MNKILAASLLGTAMILSGTKANAAIIGDVEGTLSLKKTVPNTVFIPEGQDQVLVSVGASSTLTTMFETDAEDIVNGIKAIFFSFNDEDISDKNESVNIPGAGLQTEIITYQFSQEFLLSPGTYNIVASGVFFGDGKIVNPIKSTSFTVAAATEEAPEPLTLLGSATALGLGALLKREHSKRQGKTKA